MLLLLLLLLLMMMMMKKEAVMMLNGFYCKSIDPLRHVAEATSVWRVVGHLLNHSVDNDITSDQRRLTA